MQINPMISIERINNPEPHQIYQLVKQLNPDLSFDTFCRYLADMLMQEYFIIAAYENDEMIGLTGCWTATKFYCGKYLEIDNFIVDEQHRGKSIGDKILTYVFEEAKRLACDSITLNAYIWNEDAHRFYDRYNFETLGKHRIIRL